MDNTTILTWITFIPLIGMVIIPFLPKSQEGMSKWISLTLTAVQLVMAVVIFNNFDRNVEGLNFQMVHGPISWIPSFGINYKVGIDSISVSMVILSALISFIAVIASWGISKHVKAYFAMLLLLNTGMMGTFIALDMFLFYIFWEIMLLPMYFLIGIWGGPRREYAAIKFFLYTLAGSVFMLLAIVALYWYGGTFDVETLMKVDTLKGPLALGETFNTARFICWLAFFVGFAIKVPMFPFHTWLPDAHVEAPTAISVILAGVLLKMGTYGMLRFNYGFFPDITYAAAGTVALFGVINIVYGALCAMAQTDLKKLIAYSSVSHMGFVLLGMSSFTEQGINGAVLQMFNHGTITAMLFILVGVIYDRAHHREINKFGGLYVIMPRYAVWIGFAFFAALGLPGLSGFIAEALVFLGSFKAFPTLTIIALTGVVLGAAYLLWTIQRAFLGEANEKYKGFPDINTREVISLVPLAILVLVLGVYPKPMLDLIGKSIVALNNHVLTNKGAIDVVSNLF